MDEKQVSFGKKLLKEIFSSRTLSFLFCLYLFFFTFFDYFISSFVYQANAFFGDSVSKKIFFLFICGSILEILNTCLLFFRAFFQKFILEYIANKCFTSFLKSFVTNLQKRPMLFFQENLPIVEIYSTSYRNAIDETLKIITEYTFLGLRLLTQVIVIYQNFSVFSKDISFFFLLFFSIGGFTFFILIRTFLFYFWKTCVYGLTKERALLNAHLSTIDNYSQEIFFYHGENFERKRVQESLDNLQGYFFEDNLYTLVFRSFNYDERKKTLFSFLSLVLFFYLSGSSLTALAPAHFEMAELSFRYLTSFQAAIVKLVDLELLCLPKFFFFEELDEQDLKFEELYAPSLKRKKTQDKFSFSLKNFEVAVSPFSEKTYSFEDVSFTKTGIIYTTKQINSLFYACSSVLPFKGNIRLFSANFLTETGYINRFYNNLFSFVYNKPLEQITESQKQRIITLAGELNLADLAKRPTIAYHNLSKGELKRVCILSCIVTGKPLILESPTNSLDMDSERKVYQFISKNYPEFLIFTLRSSNLDIFKKRYTY